jgi:cytochrome-b5 reductase
VKKDTGIPVPSAPATKVFTGGEQGFVSLKLDDIEIVNHNTKKFRFSFDDLEAVSGLNIACKD